MDLIFASNVLGQSIGDRSFISTGTRCYSHAHKIRDFDTRFSWQRGIFLSRARVRDIMISRWKPFLGIVFIFARAITTN